MQPRFDDDAFGEAEQRVKQGIYRDYRETGEALRQVRDEGREHWRSLYGTWSAYLEEAFGICRQTAAVWIKAAEVAADLSSYDDSLRLPVRHANLLARFEDSDVRLMLAIKIQHLGFTEAARLVIDFSTELVDLTAVGPSRAGRSDERRDALAQFDVILRGCASLDNASLVRAAARLGDERRRRLARKATAAGRALIKVSAALIQER